MRKRKLITIIPLKENITWEQAKQIVVDLKAGLASKEYIIGIASFAIGDAIPNAIAIFKEDIQ